MTIDSTESVRNAIAEKDLSPHGQEAFRWICFFALLACFPWTAIATSTQKSVRYQHDADGQRVARIQIAEDSATGELRTNVVRYLYDTQAIGGYSQRLVEIENGKVASVFVRGAGAVAEWKRPSDPGGTSTGSVSFHLSDGHGSTRLQISPSGLVASRRDYDAFGVGLALGESATDGLGYTGEFWDSALQEVDLRARTYDPALGRFPTVDSYEGTASSPASLHKYLYCQQNPVNGADPSGHDLNAGSMAGSMAGRTGLATLSSSTIGRSLVTSRNLIGRSMVQAMRLRMGDPTEYLVSRLVGAGLSVGTVGIGLGLGLAFEESEETRGRVLYRGMSGESTPDLLPEGETEAGKYLGIRPKDIADVQNGMVMPTAQGLSVTPNNPSLMHPFMLEKIAKGKARVWGIYEGFLDPLLMVRPDPENLKGHAFIGVAVPISVAEFKRLIAETQRMWSSLSP